MMDWDTVPRYEAALKEQARKNARLRNVTTAVQAARFYWLDQPSDGTRKLMMATVELLLQELDTALGVTP